MLEPKVKFQAKDVEDSEPIIKVVDEENKNVKPKKNPIESNLGVYLFHKCLTR